MKDIILLDTNIRSVAIKWATQEYPRHKIQLIDIIPDLKSFITSLTGPTIVIPGASKLKNSLDLSTWELKDIIQSFNIHSHLLQVDCNAIIYAKAHVEDNEWYDNALSPMRAEQYIHSVFMPLYTEGVYADSTYLTLYEAKMYNLT